MTLKSRIARLEAARPQPGRSPRRVVMMERYTDTPDQCTRNDGKQGTEAELTADLPSNAFKIMVNKSR